MFLKTAVPVCFLLLFLFSAGCSGDRTRSGKEITVRISATNTIVVNADTVAIDNLAAKLRALGVNAGTKVRLLPHPVAGTATVEEVQRIIGVVKSSVPAN